MKHAIKLFVLAIFMVPIVYGQAKVSGTISGQVLDKDTQSPLPGVNVTILGTQMGAATDEQGKYRISNVPVGSYAVQFSFIGYERVIKTDIIVKSSRTTSVHAELPFAVLEMQGVVVTGGYFSETQEQPVSAVNFSYEEIRRSPGSHGDVNRIISVLPSVAPSPDQTNNLVVRGGNPGENAYYVDNIPIPNINHFPTQGSAGGALGILNVEFIQDVNFFSGGFSAAYGDRLSSVMDITLREGNHVPFDGQIDLNWAGYGFVGEGVLPQNKGSWLFSARRSYLDLLVKAIDVGNTIAPRYGDVLGKLVYDINSNHKLSLIGVCSDDHNRADKQTAIENDMVAFMNQDIIQNTTGLNWRALWNQHGYSNTSLAYTQDTFKEDAYDTGTEQLLLKNRTTNQYVNLRNINHFRVNARHALEFGVEARYIFADFDNFYGEQLDPAGNFLPAISVLRSMSTAQSALFASYVVRPLNKMTITLGGRATYFTITPDITFAPRFSLAFQLSPITTFNIASGIYYQNLPLVLYSQNPEFEKLNSTRAEHMIIGIDHMLREDTKLSVEVYRKNYDSFPMDPNQPEFFIIDEPFYDAMFYTIHENLLDTGAAYAQGVELMLQKKLAKNVYGLASFSYFRSRYQDFDGVWRDRIFDSRVLASVEGGYKPNNKWEISLHWMYSGGRPFTPFDMDASRAANAGILDVTRVNQKRYPDFNWLNIRVDRRFHFSRSNMVVYLSVYNALNRKNVSTYFWDTVQNEPNTIYQWGTLPIFGIEYEF